MNNASKHVLARLEVGFRTDSTRLKELQERLQATVAEAREFGRVEEASVEWQKAWHRRWDEIERTLDTVQRRLSEMENAVEKRDSQQLQAAIESWTLLQAAEASMAQTWRSLRHSAADLEGIRQSQWDLLTCRMESGFQTIGFCAEALRVKLELLRNHSAEEVHRVVNNVLDRLPTPSGSVEATDGWLEGEYEAAARELETERHRYMGFMDVVKGLLLWTETTKERSAKHPLFTTTPR